MTDANTSSSSTPVFRTVEVSTGVSITLGGPLSPEARGLGHQTGERFTLNKGTYKNATEIDIQLTGTDELVQQMDFSYAAGSNYGEMVAEYEAELGPPTSQSGSGKDEVTVWKDDATEFRLVNSAAGIRSMLRDLAPTS